MIIALFFATLGGLGIPSYFGCLIGSTSGHLNLPGFQNATIPAVVEGDNSPLLAASSFA